MKKKLWVLGLIVTFGIFQAEICHGAAHAHATKMPNPGTRTHNTNCFIDSVMQILFHAKPLVTNIFLTPETKFKADSAALLILNGLKQLGQISKANNDFETLRDNLAIASFDRFGEFASQSQPAASFWVAVMNSLRDDALTPEMSYKIHASHAMIELEPAEGDLKKILTQKKINEHKGFDENLALVTTGAEIKDCPAILSIVLVRTGAKKNMAKVIIPTEKLLINGKEYSLFGIICLSGAEEGGTGGHYWTYAKYFGDGTWYYYNNAPGMYAPGYIGKPALDSKGKPIMDKGKQKIRYEIDPTLCKYTTVQCDNREKKEAAQQHACLIEESQIKNITEQRVEQGFPEVLFYQRSDWKPEEKIEHKIDEKPEEPITPGVAGDLPGVLGILKAKLLALVEALGNIAKK